MRVVIPFFAVLSAVAAPLALADQPQGIDYLGAGYDLVFGNPDGSEASSSVTDPGFRTHLIKYNWNDEDNTCSGLHGNWTCPREVSIMPDTSCMQQSSSSMISSTKEFQEVLQEDCSISASVGGGFGGFSAEASFSGSKSMASMQNKIQKEDITTFQSKAVCVEYTASLKLGFATSPLQPLPEFVSALGILPLAYNACYVPSAAGGPCPQRVASSFGDLPPVRTTGSRRLQAASNDLSMNNCACDASVAEYFRFIQLFGTHYTTRVEMGGKIVHRVEIKNSDVEELTKTKVDVAYGASIKASYKMLIASASVSVDAQSSNSEAANAFKSVMSVAKKEININVGGSPSEDWREWAKSTTDTPMPIRYRLSSLIDLIQIVDPLKVAPFEAAVEDYIAAYSKTLTFEGAHDAKVQSLLISYSLDTPFMGWAKFRVMIGKVGDMLPAEVNVTDTTGSFTIAVPAKYRVSVDPFDDHVPITLEFVTGRFYPPLPSVKMEAKRAQQHNANDRRHWINMEAEHAIAEQGITGTKATFGFTTPTVVTLISLQKFAVISDGTVKPLDDPYAGKRLTPGAVWTINPSFQ